jgi:hypothetical protein
MHRLDLIDGQAQFAFALLGQGTWSDQKVPTRDFWLHPLPTHWVSMV